MRKAFRLNIRHGQSLCGVQLGMNLLTGVWEVEGEVSRSAVTGVRMLICAANPQYAYRPVSGKMRT